jgi:hypothetical protein
MNMGFGIRRPWAAFLTSLGKNRAEKYPPDISISYGPQ